MSMRTRAAVARPGSGTFVWEDVTLDDPRPDEALVRIVGAGICHTDIAARAGQVPTPLPAVFGHEGAGVVEAVGSEVTGLAPGDSVVLSFSSCGRCLACRRGHPASCEHFFARNFGGARPDGSTPVHAADGSDLGGRFFGQSSFAEHAVVDARCAVPVLADTEDELALLAPLGCAVQTGAGTVLNVLRPGAGSTVAVFGAGAVGLSAVLGATLTLAERVIAIDILPSRLELALELGATHVINGRTEDVQARLDEITGGRGVTGAVESSGVPELLRQAVDSLATGNGTVAVVGTPPLGTEGTFDINSLVVHGRSIRGVAEGDSDLVGFVPALVGLSRSGRFPFERMIRTYPPERINEAAADAASGEVVKPLLCFRP
ncbi:NAD(P)-dependent alcohol dehydrogenase [Streptomyces iconiensis]|uniref:NAD(P)-dependent alcohol dehydrogenase n=1 Tax=Streptomyces iconiensis TaxID=1384038 RepID=A0ABT7AB13_9ACTN|nr:NAD(P)-dependent alcohol dehydrogenase [Streptomyces iconiensis]MDJ1138524.1 NAD(P)-dependent alcohol dehydrogenase [Streptomyces iconiensis]